MPISDLVRQLRDLRISAGHTQLSLSREIGLSVGAIGNYESGTREPTFEVCERWAAACGATVHLVVAKPGETPEKLLGDDDARVLRELRDLSEADRALAEAFVRALKTSEPGMKEMIAVQVHVLASRRG